MNFKKWIKEFLDKLTKPQELDSSVDNIGLGEEIIVILKRSKENGSESK